MTTSTAGLRRTFRLDHHHRRGRSMVGATDRLEKSAGDLIKAFRAEIGLHCRQTGKAPLPGSKDSAGAGPLKASSASFHRDSEIAVSPMSRQTAASRRPMRES